MFAGLKKIFYKEEDDFFKYDPTDTSMNSLHDNFLEKLEECYAYLIDDPIKVWKYEDVPQPFLAIIVKHLNNKLPKPTWVSFVPNPLETFNGFIGIYKKIDLVEGYIYLLK